MVESEEGDITWGGHAPLDYERDEEETPIEVEEKKKYSKKRIKINVEENLLVPKHEIVSEEEKEELMRKYGPLELFPKILSSDPMVERLGAKPGDLIKVYRSEGIYYRYVVGERSY